MLKVILLIIVSFSFYTIHFAEDVQEDPDSKTDYREWKLTRFGPDFNPLARCLDGSYAGFWFSKGHGSGINKFIVHHMGGGWCKSVEDCYERGQHKKYGSSDDWLKTAICKPDGKYDPKVKDDSIISVPCDADGGMSGIFSYNSKEAPLTYNWNKVYVPYCDGASFAGEVEDPTIVEINGKQHEVFFRGKYILDAVYHELLSKFSLNYASDVIISGSSAGGLTVFIHLDYIADMIKRKTQLSRVNIAGAPDAGFFLDHPSINGEDRFDDRLGFKDFFTFQKVQSSLNSKCLDDYKEDNQGWKCLFPQNFLSYITTPMFIVNSYSDMWQLPNVMGFTCPGGVCSQEKINFINNFRDKMIGYIINGVNSKSGAWVTGCATHTISGHEKLWEEVKVEKFSLKEAFNDWYNNTFYGKKLIHGKRFFFDPRLPNNKLYDCDDLIINHKKDYYKDN